MTDQRVVTSEGRLPRMEQGWEIGTFWKGPVLISLWWLQMCVFVKTRVAAACVLYSMQGTPRQERNGNGSVGVGVEVQTGSDSSGCEDEAF